jgi:hypothetical protein
MAITASRYFVDAVFRNVEQNSADPGTVRWIL